MTTRRALGFPTFREALHVIGEQRRSVGNDWRELSRKPLFLGIETTRVIARTAGLLYNTTISLGKAAIGTGMDLPSLTIKGKQLDPVELGMKLIPRNN